MSEERLLYVNVETSGGRIHQFVLPESKARDLRNQWLYADEPTIIGITYKGTDYSFATQHICLMTVEV